MATPIKRIEKDFLLKVLFDEQIPIMLSFARTEYVLKVAETPKLDIKFKPNAVVTGLRAGGRLDLMFDYRGQTITFSVMTEDLRDGLIVAEAPEFLYKNLSRSYSRVLSPTDLRVSFSFHGDRYVLAFPKLQDFEPMEEPAYSEHFDPKDIKELINQLAVWANEAGSGHKLVMFKDARPSAMEERVISQTGKILFLPSTQTDLPQVDPFPKARIVTEEIFRRFLEGSGTDRLQVDNAIARFLKEKRDAGIYSDAWVPILFQEYVIGYIRVWVDTVGKPPFDYGVIDNMSQFAKVLAFSLKERGYFKAGQVKKEIFQGKVIDVSASGLLFAYPHSALAEALLPDSELDVQLATPKRTLNVGARIVRRYKDSRLHYFGCRYSSIAPEDLRFLFEHIYGKPFTDADTSALVGKM
jgi:hypothetical protein